MCVKIKMLIMLAGLAAGVFPVTAGEPGPLAVDDRAVTQALRGYQAAMVIMDAASGRIYRYHPELCQEPLSPCSTFKIANALCALENGLVDSADTVIPWDGKERWNPAWNKDLTLKQAMAVSAVPHFQQLAAQAGEATMQNFLDRIHYGNRNITGGIKQFWLGSSLLISADQQADFLRQLVNSKLPVTPHSRQVVYDIMFQQQGKNGRLYGKTGTGVDAGNHVNLGWYVGWVDTNSTQTYVFAVNIRQGKKPSGPLVKQRLIALFEKLGWL